MVLRSNGSLFQWQTSRSAWSSLLKKDVLSFKSSLRIVNFSSMTTSSRWDLKNALDTCGKQTIWYTSGNLPIFWRIWRSMEKRYPRACFCGDADTSPSLVWIITESLFSMRSIFSSRHPLSSTTRIPFSGIRIQTSNSFPKSWRFQYMMLVSSRYSDALLIKICSP